MLFPYGITVYSKVTDYVRLGYMLYLCINTFVRIQLVILRGAQNAHIWQRSFYTGSLTRDAHETAGI